MSNRDTAQYDRVTEWYINHLRAFLSSLGESWRKPFASFMTVMVIGIAVALPFGLYVLLQNLQDISQHWNNRASISLYLKKGTPDYQIKDLLNQIQQNKSIQTVEYVSPQQGLRDFEKVTRFGNILSELKQNPLPGVVVVTPTDEFQSPEKLQILLATLEKSPHVDLGQMDLAWVKRLYFIITIGKRITYSLTLLFGLGVLLVIGNTIRLTIEHHHLEMMILKMVGATDAFIRRPFLYRGLIYGLFGGAASWILVAITLSWLKPPAQALANSYSQTVLLAGLPISAGITILLLSSILGILGAWLATDRHLRTLM
ncbi:MAG: permease-like cell division protein FtsX [Coxiellaceae bacterium]|nr:permease-like cell division protein FtsX [Coxiellaceae bacterium]